MKVAWIAYGSLEERTGGTIYDAIVVEGLRRAGDEVSVLDANVLDAGALVRRVASLCPDAVVGDELCHTELAVVFACPLAASKILLVHHLTWWEVELAAGARERARLREATALRHADAVVTTSEATRDRLRREGCRAPIAVVRPGADRLAGVGSAAPSSPRAPAFLFVGTLLPRKRVVELVHAMAQAPAATLTIVGSRTRDPRYAREVEQAIASLGLAGRVRMTGELSEVELAGAMASADVLVLPSSLEGYGIAATEGARAGLAVVAAETPGVVEALSACAASAAFFDPAEPGSLASTLARLASVPARVATMREEARRAAPNLPTWADGVSAFRAALLDHAVRRKSAASSSR